MNTLKDSAPADIQGDESIVLYREMLVLYPSPHPDRFRCLNNLTSALRIMDAIRPNARLRDHQ